MEEEICFCAFELTHHWQLVEIQQLFDQASQHVLTLPHLIQSPERTESERWGDYFHG